MEKVTGKIVNNSVVTWHGHIYSLDSVVSL